MRHGRICGLAEARKPFRIPRIEPVVDIMRGKEDVKVCVVGLQWQLHQEKRQMNRQRNHEQQAQGYRPRPRFKGLRFLHDCLSKKRGFKKQTLNRSRRRSVSLPVSALPILNSGVSQLFTLAQLSSIERCSLRLLRRRYFLLSSPLFGFYREVCSSAPYIDNRGVAKGIQFCN